MHKAVVLVKHLTVILHVFFLHVKLIRVEVEGAWGSLLWVGTRLGVVGLTEFCELELIDVHGVRLILRAVPVIIVLLTMSVGSILLASLSVSIVGARLEDIGRRHAMRGFIIVALGSSLVFGLTTFVVVSLISLHFSLRSKNLQNKLVSFESLKLKQSFRFLLQLIKKRSFKYWV